MPPSLRFLKGLVIILMLTMIGGVIALVALLVTRLPAATNGPRAPEALQLPQGEIAEAFTYGKDWSAVVTQSGKILIFDASGKMRQEVLINP